MQKHPIWGNEMTLPCFLGGIFFIILTKTLKKNMDNTLYGKTKQHYIKHVISVFFFFSF